MFVNKNVIGLKTSYFEHRNTTPAKTKTEFNLTGAMLLASTLLRGESISVMLSVIMCKQKHSFISRTSFQQSNVAVLCYSSLLHILLFGQKPYS